MSLKCIKVSTFISRALHRHAAAASLTGTLAGLIKTSRVGRTGGKGKRREGAKAEWDKEKGERNEEVAAIKMHR